MEDSFVEESCALSSGIDINIFNIVVFVSERSFNDVMFNDISVVGFDISFLFMFDLLGSILFYEIFIVFFLICIKALSDMILFFDFILEFESVNDLVIKV